MITHLWIFDNQLQQYLPLAVLKLTAFFYRNDYVSELQQYLPLAVLKLLKSCAPTLRKSSQSLLQQYLPLAVLKLVCRACSNRYDY